MLGKYTVRQQTGLGAMGVNVQDVVATTVRTQQTLDKILPTVEMIADDYGKISPGVDFIANYWYTALALIAIVGAAGAAAGSYIVLKRLER